MSTSSRSSFDFAAHRRRRACRAKKRWTAIPSAKGLPPTDGLSGVTNPLPQRRSGRLRLVYGLDSIEILAEIAFRDLNVTVVLQLSQSCAVVPSASASRSAVPAVMPGCSLAVRSIRARNKPHALVPPHPDGL